MRQPWGAHCRSRPPPLPSFGRVGIAGPGLIGGSIGLRARALGHEVIGWDVDEANLALALERGAVSARAGSLAELAGSCDLLVLAGPLDVTIDQLALLAALDRVPELSIDVASVKAPVARAGRALRGFVASHPIAGSERRGVAAARADLFADKIWAYDAAAAAASAGHFARFAEALGAVTLPIDVDEHDRVVALTSHLPQLTSVALGRMLDPRLGEPAVSALCGTGISSMLRLGASSWMMWRAILAANGRPVAQEVRALAAVLMGFAEALESGAPDTLERDFLAAADAVSRLEANVAAGSAVDAKRHDTDER